MKIRAIGARDIRFPTSIAGDGSDAQHHDPDYSCAYVVVFTEGDAKGYGLSFTIGRGTEILVLAVKSLAHIVVGMDMKDIVKDFANVWRRLTNDSQLRWLGPEKGVIHLAASVIINALWDLWARMEQKPVWKLLVDLSPEQLVSTIDFTYIDDVLTREEAVKMLEDMAEGKAEREAEIQSLGYPCYTTSAGWLNYDDDKIRRLLQIKMAEGFTRFKVKVGGNLEEDKKRLALVREVIGPDRKLMIDANQVWNVNQAIEWVKELAEFKPVWIEEPTSPDDILGHAAIAKAVNPLGIKVATGEHCQNRVLFKQLLQADGMQYCQIDACRLGGINEVLAVLLMCKKFGVPVCPHAGGVGLCEMVQHLAIFNYVSVAGGDKAEAPCEYAEHLHEHFVYPVEVRHGAYLCPLAPGYGVEMLSTSLMEFEYPLGPAWKALFKDRVYQDPAKETTTPYVVHSAEGHLPALHFQRVKPIDKATAGSSISD